MPARLRPYAALCGLFALAACASEVVPDRRDPVAPPPIERTTRQTEEMRACLTDLSRTGARFSPMADVSNGSCSVTNSVGLSWLASDDGGMRVTNVDRLSCPVALSAAGWARYGADRAAAQILGSPVATVETMGTYACRNVAGTRRLSAHASAQAIDISAFVLADGRRITVKDGWNGSEAERRFLRIVHASACKRFGTVLGPDYNAAHRDHFHVEPGGGGFCR